MDQNEQPLEHYPPSGEHPFPQAQQANPAAQPSALQSTAPGSDAKATVSTNPTPPQYYYPDIPNNATVNPEVLGWISNLPPSTSTYAIVGQWHIGFETWAYNRGLYSGMVAHFNVRAGAGDMLHLYYNAYGGLEVVPHGYAPSGF